MSPSLRQPCYRTVLAALSTSDSETPWNPSVGDSREQLLPDEFSHPESHPFGGTNPPSYATLPGSDTNHASIISPSGSEAAAAASVVESARESKHQQAQVKTHSGSKWCSTKYRILHAYPDRYQCIDTDASGGHDQRHDQIMDKLVKLSMQQSQWSTKTDLETLENATTQLNREQKLRPRGCTQVSIANHDPESVIVVVSDVGNLVVRSLEAARKTWLTHGTRTRGSQMAD